MAGFTSESVAAFRRNGWLTCVGISGRLGSEYAVLRKEVYLLFTIIYTTVVDKSILSLYISYNLY